MALVKRFSRTERAGHWLIAVAFGVMLLSSSQVPHNWTWTTPALDIHVGAAVVLVAGLAGLLLCADGRALRRSVRDLRTLTAQDREWLSPGRILQRRPPPPVGRFNAGQKVNSRLLLLGLVALYATGLALVTLGHSTFGDLHGPFAFITSMLIAAHIFMAVINPSTRHALRGMTLGTVDREWATHHHPRWVDELDAQERPAEQAPGS
ncbi:MAG TPA: cytochrome b/b6 domain-containing protein [Gaiellales bacterium]|nr:cytochrome b/b6 domain-containing protein [Gaiellales bacterium]